MVACLSVFSFSSRVDAEETENSGKNIIVSLGDSYSSGEGIEPFFGQDEEISMKINNEDWLAHRSERSWSSLLTLPDVEGTMYEK